MTNETNQLEEKDFKFYPNFLKAIEVLPEEKRAKACYEFCKFGVTGILPEDENIAMFCIGVSASVQKYQGRGGARQGAGRKSKIQKNQKIQNNQNIHNEQTETETETETKTETKTKTKIIYNTFGEFQNIKLSTDEENKLKLLYGDKFNEAIETLSNYIACSGKKYSKHYAVLNKSNWVYKKIVGEKPYNPNKESILQMIKEA